TISHMPGPAYRIETPRLLLRCWDPRDARALSEAIQANHAHIGKWLPWVREEPNGVAEKLEWIRKKRGMFDLGQDFAYAVFDRGETNLLGGLGLTFRLGPEAREIGYWLRLDECGHGYITEGAAALTRVAFEIDKVQRAEIHCEPTNTKSSAVAARLNFRLDGTLRKRFQDPQGAKDRQIWSLFADEYPGSPASSAEMRAFNAAGEAIDTTPSAT